MPGKENGKFPNFLKIIRLWMVVRERWVKIYAVFLVLFSLLVVLSLFLRKNHPSSAGNLIFTASLQLIAFIVVFCLIKKGKMSIGAADVIASLLGNLVAAPYLAIHRYDSNHLPSMLWSTAPCADHFYKKCTLVLQKQGQWLLHVNKEMKMNYKSRSFFRCRTCVRD